MNDLFWKNKKIIITGGAGFIGSSLTRALVSRGAHVRVLDNLWRGSLENLRSNGSEFVIDLDKQFSLVDLTDQSSCKAHLTDADLVYHLADVVGGVKFAFDNEPFIFRQNILINTNTLNACLSNAISQYIYVGTACSYSKHLQSSESVSRLREEQAYPTEPESSYGWSKLMGEYEAALFADSGLMEIGVLRLHNVYGPGSVYAGDLAQVLPALTRKAIRFPEEKFVVWGSGNQYRDFVYIDDVVDALLSEAEMGMGAGLIQIGSERPTSIREAAELIVEISGKPIHIEYDLNAPEGDKGRVAVCDKARQVLGWQPKIDIREGLENLYRSLEPVLR